MEYWIDHSSLCRSLGIFLVTVGMVFGFSAELSATSQKSKAPKAVSLRWQSAARWRHGLKKTHGTLAITDVGVEFQPAQGPSLCWPIAEIQTFDLAAHSLTITGYENRHWYLYGERSFHFELESSVPSTVAAQLAKRVGKPSKNGLPDQSAPALAILGARRRTLGGGTNGVLRFRNSGIDYTTDSGRGARSWRWADIQTLAHPDPFHFRVGGYREIVEFELKEPMSPELFDQVWREVYARDLRVVSQRGGNRP